MEQENFGHMATSKLMGQRPTTHYTLAKLRDLAVVTIVWLTIMECSFLLQKGTMISADIPTVQALMEAVDGGITAAITQS